MCFIHLPAHFKYIKRFVQASSLYRHQIEFTSLCVLFAFVTVDNFNGADDIQDNAVMGLAYSTFQRILGHSPQVLNPIDRLYSMQNYYFRCNNRESNEPDDNDGM